MRSPVASLGAGLCLLALGVGLGLGLGLGCGQRSAPESPGTALENSLENSLENKAPGVVAATAAGHLVIIVQGNIQWMGSTDPELPFPGAYEGVGVALDQLGQRGGAIETHLIAAGPEPKELFRGPLSKLSAAELGPRDWFMNNITADLGAALRDGGHRLESAGRASTGPRVLVLLSNGHSVSADFAAEPFVADFKAQGALVYTIYFDPERRTAEGQDRLKTLGFTRSFNAPTTPDLGSALIAVVDDAF